MRLGAGGGVEKFSSEKVGDKELARGQPPGDKGHRAAAGMGPGLHHADPDGSSPRPRSLGSLGPDTEVGCSCPQSSGQAEWSGSSDFLPGREEVDCSEEFLGRKTHPQMRG